MKKYLFILVFSSLFTNILYAQGNIKPSFIYAETVNYHTIDPVTASNTISQRIVELLFGSLYTFDLDRNIIEEFADGMPEVSADNMTAVVTIRQNLKWSDGSNLTADDIVFSFKALTSPKSEGKNGELLKKIINDITKISNYKIKFHFNKKTINPEKYITFFILPKRKFNKPAIKKYMSYCRKPYPVSGHYKIQLKEDEAFSIRFNKNKHYSVQQPQIEEIQLNTFSNIQALPDLLMGGSTDMLTSIMPDQYAYLNSSGSIKLQPYDSNSFPVLILNFESPLLKSLEIRRALDMAIDREEIVESIYVGQGDPMSGPFTMNNPYNNPEVEFTGYDPDGANEILDGLGFTERENNIRKKGDLKLELDFVTYRSNDPSLQRVFITLQNKWEKIGIKVNLKSYLRNSYFDKIEKRKFDITYFERKFDLASEVFTLFSSEYGGIGGSNLGNYQNPQVDKFLYESIITPDFQTKIEINKTIHKLLHDDVANIFLWQIKDYAAYTNKLKHISIDPFYFFSTIGDWEVKKSNDDEMEW